MSELPPRQRLARIVRELTRQLPRQMTGLLEDARFDGGRSALARLGDEATLDAAVASLSLDEAAFLADRLLARWQLLAPVVLEPAAAIDAPEEIWLGDAPVRVELALRVVDAEPGWEVVWDGATAGPDASLAVATASPPGDGPAVLAVRAHVRARSAAGRAALVASVRVPLRRPRLVVSDDRRRIVVTDHTGRPAVGVRLTIGAAAHRTGPGGLVELTEAAPPDAVTRVEGILAGRIPA